MRTSFKPCSLSCAAWCCALCGSGCQSEAMRPAAVDALPLACSSGLPGQDASCAFPNTPCSLGKYRLVPGIKNEIQCLRARDLAAFWWRCSNLDLCFGNWHCCSAARSQSVLAWMETPFASGLWRWLFPSSNTEIANIPCLPRSAEFIPHRDHTVQDVHKD